MHASRIQESSLICNYNFLSNVVVLVGGGGGLCVTYADGIMHHIKTFCVSDCVPWAYLHDTSTVGRTDCTPTPEATAHPQPDAPQLY